MTKILSKICIVLVSGILVSACYKKPDVANTATVDMSGEWWVDYYLEEAPTESLTGYGALLTYNTSDNSTSQIWIEDHVGGYKSKVAVDYASMTFPETASTENLESPGTNMRILEGKVLKDAGRSTSGVVVDSIYLKIEFVDDEPGVIYQVRGHMKTGFFEDEH